jgi:hypothetical protein
MQSIHAIPMPKPIKAPAAPKIASIHIGKIGNGFKVQHNMTRPPQPHPFVFQNPAKMVQHLGRIQSSAWREPDRNEGAAVTKDLNLGPAA